MFEQLARLMGLRNSHPAFDGNFLLQETVDDQLNLKWEGQNDWIELNVDLQKKSFTISGTEKGAGVNFFPDCV